MMNLKYPDRERTQSVGGMEMEAWVTGMKHAGKNLHPSKNKKTANSWSVCLCDPTPPPPPLSVCVHGASDCMSDLIKRRRALDAQMKQERHSGI